MIVAVLNTKKGGNMDRSFFVEFSKTVDLLNSAESKALTPIHRNVIDKGCVLSSMKFSEGHVLCTLFKLDRPITVARLAAHCSIMVNNISKPLRTLIEGGFVSETKDTGDRRKQIHTKTCKTYLHFHQQFQDRRLYP